MYSNIVVMYLHSQGFSVKTGKCPGQKIFKFKDWFTSIPMVSLN